MIKSLRPTILYCSCHHYSVNWPAGMQYMYSTSSAEISRHAHTKQRYQLKVHSVTSTSIEFGTQLRANEHTNQISMLSNGPPAVLNTNSRHSNSMSWWWPVYTDFIMNATRENFSSSAVVQQYFVVGFIFIYHKRRTQATRWFRQFEHYNRSFYFALLSGDAKFQNAHFYLHKLQLQLRKKLCRPSSLTERTPHSEITGTPVDLTCALVINYKVLTVIVKKFISTNSANNIISLGAFHILRSPQFLQVNAICLPCRQSTPAISIRYLQHGDMQTIFELAG